MNDSMPEHLANTSCENGTNGFKRIVYPVAYMIIFALGTFGQSLSICVFFSQWRKQKSLTPVNLIMVNLLLSDLMLVCSLPLRISYYLLDSYWPFGDIACRLIFYVFYLNMYISVYFLVALNILRYIAIVWPYLYLQLNSTYLVGVLCAVIWLLMAVASSPLLFSKKEKQEGSTHCLDLSIENIDRLIHINIVSLIVGFVLPLLVIIFCCIFVVKGLLTPSPALDKLRHCRKKSCALVIISLGIFLVCYLPYHVVRTIFLSVEKQLKMNGIRDSCSYIAIVRKAAVITHCLCTTNSCLNPILFFFVGEKFRKFFERRKIITKRNVQEMELMVLRK